MNTIEGKHILIPIDEYEELKGLYADEISNLEQHVRDERQKHLDITSSLIHYKDAHEEIVKVWEPYAGYRDFKLQSKEEVMKYLRENINLIKNEKIDAIRKKKSFFGLRIVTNKDL